MVDRAVVIPQLNANEDRVTVVKVLVSEGAKVRAGDPVATVETTKASVDITAPCSGTIGKIDAVEGREMEVGAVLCYLASEATGHVAAGTDDVDPGDAPATDRGAIKITAKARLRAEELGVDIGQILPAEGRVGVAEVEAYASKLRQPTAAPERPALGKLKAVVVGGGQHAACIIDAVAASGYELIGCVDSVKPAGHPVFGGLKVLGPVEMLESLRPEGVEIAFIGVGGATDNSPRARLFDLVAGLGYLLPPVIHPAAYVAPGVTIGPGSVVLAKASIGPETSIGANVIINQGCIVCHHCTIGDHAHIAPGGILAGGCQVGSGSTVGMGSTLFINVSVGRWCLIHNGVSVVSNIPDHAVIKKNHQGA